MSFKVGDSVHCNRLGCNGKVIVDNHKDPVYPLEVEFNNGSTEVYTADGRIYDGEDVCLVLNNENIVGD